MKKIVIFLPIILMLAFQTKGQQPAVNGEIIADTNNITILKVWGTSEERGYAYGYLLHDKIRDVFDNWIRPWYGPWFYYKEARQMIIDGDILIIDSLIRKEAQAVVNGMADAGGDTSNFDDVSFLTLSFSLELGSFLAKEGPMCSTFINWGDATSGTGLDGGSVISRHFDNPSWIPASINNAVVTVHIPAETDQQPWLNVDAAGFIIPWGAGVNKGGISIYVNGMSDCNAGPVVGEAYQSSYYLARKVLESADYNGDGVNNTQDVRDAFNENPQGFPGNHIISTVAKLDPASDSLTAMIAEISPGTPCLTFRTNAYNDTIPGDNLYAANSQIKRNHENNYCSRYLEMSAHIGDGTGIGSQENWDLMANYSHTSGYNYMLCQHIPDANILKISNYRDGIQAYLLPPLVLDLDELFASPASVHNPAGFDVGLKLFPNPASDQVNIKVENDDISLQRIEVFNSMGKLIKTVRPEKERKVLIIDLKDYPPGIYYIKLNTGKLVITKKVIKH